MQGHIFIFSDLDLKYIKGKFTEDKQKKKLEYK